MNESTKSKRFWGPVEKEAIRGKGIDIGCGPDPVTPDARRFDKEDGDANHASQYVKEEFDFVYSSHCLEHMHDPRLTILDWWKLVKVGGYLFVSVPDEDLYEQGVFPSRFNDDHKATFTLSKSKSWSPVSCNVLALAQSLPGGQLVSLELQDQEYDRRLMTFGKNKANIFVRSLAKMHSLLKGRVDKSHLTGLQRFLAYYYPLDQTSNPGNAQAQIQLIVRKVEP